MSKPGYKKTELGWIPEEWEVKKMKNAVEINSGTLTERNDSNYSFYYIDLSCVNKGNISFPESKLNFKNAPSRARRIVKKDNILMSTVRPNLLGFAYFDKNETDYIASTGFAVLSSKSCSSPRFIYQLLFSKIIIDQINNLVVGSNYPALNNSEVENLSIPLPPLPEQKKIAEILSTWDKAIEIKELIIEKLKLKKKGLMQKLLTGKLRFKEFVKSKELIKTRYGKVPKDWQFLKASEIFMRHSQNSNGGLELLSVTQDRGVIPRSMLEARVTMPSGSTESFKLVSKGDFVISLRAFEGGIEYSEYEGLVSPAYTIIKPKVSINNGYFKFYFKSKDFVSKLAIAVIGIRDGKQISWEDFGIIKLFYPTVEEQQKIAITLSKLDKQIEILTKQLEALKQQKKGLMQKLLTGELRVKI